MKKGGMQYDYPGHANDMPGYSYKKDGGMKGRYKNEDMKNYGNCVIEESAVRGQSIRTESNPDKSSHMVNKKEGLLGRSMPDTGTSHSLKPSMYNEKPAKPRSD